jgi:hypothetical protein
MTVSPTSSREISRGHGNCGRKRPSGNDSNCLAIAVAQPPKSTLHTHQRFKTAAQSRLLADAADREQRAGDVWRGRAAGVVADDQALVVGTEHRFHREQRPPGGRKSLRRLPRDLRGGPLNINPYFLPKTGQVAVVSTRISFSTGALPCTPNRDW